MLLIERLDLYEHRVEDLVKSLPRSVCIIYANLEGSLSHGRFGHLCPTSVILPDELGTNVAGGGRYEHAGVVILRGTCLVAQSFEYQSDRLFLVWSHEAVHLKETFFFLCVGKLSSF